MKKNRQFIIDPEATSGLDNHFTTFNKALEEVKPNTAIKITSGNYREILRIQVPDITLEPREKGGEVTVISNNEPCVHINLESDNDMCKFINITFSAYSSTRTEDVHKTHTQDDTKDNNFEEDANEKCIEEFDYEDKNMP